MPEATATSLEYEAVRLDLEYSLGVLERLSTEPERTHLDAVELRRSSLSAHLGRGLRRLLAETEDPAADV